MEAHLADGTVLQFPDETSPDVVQRVVKQHMGLSEAAPVTQQATPQESGSTIGRAISNIPQSAGKFVGGIVEAVTHPVETLKNVRDISAGAAQYLPTPLGYALRASGTPYAQQAREKAAAVGEYFKGRYGGLSNIKETFATDPVGMAADVSGLFTGGGGALSKIPALAKAGEVVSAVGRTVDPVSMAGKVVAPIASLGGKVASELSGLSTGSGGEAVREAYRAGKEGGAKAQAFTENMRGKVDPTDIVGQAKEALANIRQQRSEQYRNGMVDISSDKTVLDINPIVDAFNRLKQSGSYKGKVVKQSVVETQSKIADKLNEWASADPAQFHTPEGLDALKQAIGDIRDSTDFNTPSRVVADNVYRAIKGQIQSQAPAYAKVMSDYQKASELLSEIEHQLSLGPKGRADTALRKLQSIMRNNVQTNYGARVGSVRDLESAGSPTLTASIAGQNLNALAPRGLARIAASPLAGGTVGALAGIPAAVGYLASTSPRIAGEVAYGAGKVAKAANRIPRGTGNVLYQAQQPKDNR